MNTRFTLRTLLVLVAMVAAYLAGWVTSMSKYDSTLYELRQEKQAMWEAIDGKDQWARRAEAKAVKLRAERDDLQRKLIDCQQHGNAK